MPPLSNAVPYIVLVATCILIEVLCGDVSYMRQSAPVAPSNVTNAWAKLPANPQNGPHWGAAPKSTTTPWPALGQRPKRPIENNAVNQPSWVRPSLRPVMGNSMSSQNHRGSNAGSLHGNQQPSGAVGNLPQTNLNADDELREFSETLLNKDANNAAKYVTVNFQGKTTSRSTTDEAPLPLLSIAQDALKIPTIEKMLLLHNNYILESNVNEHYTGQEKIEEGNFLDAMLQTSVMQHTRNFLIQKGKLGRDPKEFKDLLREIWFNMYSRQGGRIGSSGFEHVFLAEIKNQQISGLHNWLYFNEEEKKQQANYLGYMKKLDLGNKGAILKYHFTFHGIDKPVGSMFIGTSPELEIALYTTCFVLRADAVCPLKLNGNKFIIRTYTYRYRGKNMIGSAFPEI